MIMNVVLTVGRLRDAMKLPDNMRVLRIEQSFQDLVTGHFHVAVECPGQLNPGATLSADDFVGLEIGPHLQKYVEENQLSQKLEVNSEVKPEVELVQAQSSQKEPVVHTMSGKRKKSVQK